MTDTAPAVAGPGQLHLTVDGAVATLTFDNPAKRNALSLDMVSQVPELLSRVADDPAVRVLVIRGAGTSAFMSGADISEFGGRRTSTEARQEYDGVSAAADRAFATLDKPVIALIHGFCLGRGLLMAMQADIRLAAEGARLGIPAARLGLGYSYSGIAGLASVIGQAHAAEMLFSARHYTAEEALRVGLVNRVLPAGRLDEACADLAATIAANAPLTIAACKAGLRALRLPPQRRDVARIDRMVDACFASHDSQEGQRAFAEKRRPTFTGD
jgi:enoyl-CoA hydratase/carnithine racemase